MRDDARNLLMAHDDPRSLHTLANYLVYGYFDPRPFRT